MKLAIAGVQYDVAEVGRLSLFDLLEMKRQTGMGVDQLQQVFADVGDDTMALLSSEEGLTALGALIWLSRRKAGEILTLEEACAFPLEELEFVEEPGDVEAAPDPR